VLRSAKYARELCLTLSGQSLEEFVDVMVLGRDLPPSSDDSASYWQHLLSWWRVLESGSADVLLLFYEDMREDLPGSVARVASWLGGAAADQGPAGEALRARVVAHSAFDYMAAPENRGLFDDHLVRERRDPCMGLAWPRAGATGKVRASGGAAGQGNAGLGPQLAAKLNSRWAVVEEATGARDYGELRALAKARGYC